MFMSHRSFVECMLCCIYSFFFYEQTEYFKVYFTLCHGWAMPAKNYIVVFLGYILIHSAYLHILKSHECSSLMLELEDGIKH